MKRTTVEPYLDYAKPSKPTLEWKYVRSTGVVFLFVLGWLLFSFGVWLRYGNIGLGIAPELVRIRADTYPRAFETTLLLAGVNFLWLFFQLARFRPRIRIVVQSLVIAAVPVLLFIIAEMFFEPFLVE